MIIRAYELKRGDIFKKLGFLFLVFNVGDGYIVYRNYYEAEKFVSGSIGRMGSNSQERVELIGFKKFERAWGSRPRKKNKIKIKKQTSCI